MIVHADQPWYRLTRHFFNALFDFGVLSEVGVQSFVRLVLGVYAVFLALGLLLVRIFMAKYGSLMGQERPEAYLTAVIGDHAFLIGVPMWIVALVTILIGHAVFPDETDFRVLMALPISRRLVFGAKLLALVLFGGLFVAAAQVALVPLFVLTSIGPWAEYTFVGRAVAYGAATLLASIFSMLAVVAVQGVILIGAPRGRMVALAAVFRSVMLCALVISLPFLLQLPFQSRALQSGARWTDFLPPAWFLGLEHVAIGDSSTSMVRLASFALIATGGVALMAISTYLLLYRRFDRVMARPSGSLEHWPPGQLIRIGGRGTRRPVLAAIRTFTSITLRRSVLHQGIVVALTAIGIGFVVNAYVRSNLLGFISGGAPSTRALNDATVWAPFVLIFVSVLAARLSLLVPVDLKANWVFRMLEQDDERLDQLRAGFRVVFWLGVIVPAVLAAPVQWLVLGPAAVLGLGSTILSGWLFVEILMRNWERIPFTCSYIPGKGFLPQTILKGFFSFVAFTTFGGALARFAGMGAPAVLYLETIVVVAAVFLARRRVATWRGTPLAFEDDLPTDVNPLRLTD